MLIIKDPKPKAEKEVDRKLLLVRNNEKAE